jgi:hypothetical protein
MMDTSDIFTSLLQLLVASWFLARALFAEKKQDKNLFFTISFAFTLLFFLTLAVGMSR